MLRYPALYKPSQNADLFNVKVFWVWILNALGHSALLFWFSLLAFGHDVVWGHGKQGGYLLLGNVVYSVKFHQLNISFLYFIFLITYLLFQYVVVTVCFKAGLVTNSWTWLNHLSIWGSIATWFLFILMYR